MIVTEKFIYSNIWDWESLELIYSTIAANTDKAFIYDCQQEYEVIHSWEEEKWEKIVSIATKNNIKIYILVGSYNTYTENYSQNFLNKIEFLNNPTFWLKDTIESLDGIHTTTVPQEYTHLFCSFINRPKNHRCDFVDQLYRTQANKLGKHTWNTFNPNYNFKHWNQTIIKSSDNFINSNVDNWIVTSPEYTNALFDIVLETTDLCSFFSEKTFKPVILKKPFIVFGAVDCNKHLKELGFLLYDELIDYKFDSVKDNRERAYLICLELKRLSNYDFKEMYSKIKSKLDYNYMHALSMYKNKKITPQDKLKELSSIISTFDFYRHSINVNQLSDTLKLNL